ncbi:unnamed protein product [Peronospora destructor]|uniref:EamA domain-containing protein n=1 Tax=Peronospora destructor TaxID=86335 RepID=A0AAV0V1K8_9STRA|nr:unnamed protein product [Peronospora destructor]
MMWPNYRKIRVANFIAFKNELLSRRKLLHTIDFEKLTQCVTGTPAFITFPVLVYNLCGYSALAGSFASLAGLLGKLAADGDSSALQLFETQCQKSSSLFDSCSLLSYFVRVLCLVLMLGANSLMLRCFVKGLHETDSLTATITSAAANFMLSAAGGFLFFQEHLPPRWFLGAFVILVGMAFLTHGNTSAEDKTKTKHE